MANKDDNTPVIKLEKLRYPDISFSKAMPAVPATSETTGNVTINNAAQPGSPSYFEATLNIPVTTTWNATGLNSALFLRVPVPATSDQTPYREVCDLALDQLAPLFRSLADQIEQELEAVSKSGSKQNAE